MLWRESTRRGFLAYLENWTHGGGTLLVLSPCDLVYLWGGGERDLADARPGVAEEVTAGREVGREG